MPWANVNEVRQDQFPGAIPITEDQYQEGIEAILDGKHIKIEGGFTIVDAPVPVIPEPPEPTLQDYAAGAQLFVEQRAKELGYNDAVTLASYTSSTIPDWAAEAQAFVAWRDEVWVYANQQLHLVETGERDQPTVNEFILELPAFDWPPAPSE